MRSKCIVCDTPIKIPDNWGWEHLCRKCIKEERAERKRFGRSFLKRETK